MLSIFYLYIIYILSHAKGITKALPRHTCMEGNTCLIFYNMDRVFKFLNPNVCKGNIKMVAGLGLETVSNSLFLFEFIII